MALLVYYVEYVVAVNDKDSFIYPINLSEFIE